MKKIYNFKGTKILSLLALATFLFVACEKQFEFDLPEANSKEDTVPPTANFSYASSIDDFKTIKFTNLSFEATTFVWDFGGGNTSTDEDATFTFPDGEGTYPVKLTASDGRGVSNEVTIDVMVVEGPFQPIIVEPGFEDNTLPDGSGDGRDSWRKSELGGVIQITGSPVTFGDQGAKLPEDRTRIGYQEIVVEPETNYDLRFWYTMLDNSSDPYVTVSIVGVTEFGPITSPQEAADGTIASVTVNDASEPDVYVEQKLSFSSGNNNTIAIYFFNGPVEARIDNFSIEVGAEGAVPPSVGFDVEQSADNFLEYSFTNTSKGGETYLWDFGDGNTSTDESPTHVYDTPDVYNVTLEVTNASGLSAVLEKPVDIQAPVTADFTFVTNQDPDNYRTVEFMDASEGAVELLWEFGDGFQFTGMNPTHTYDADGIYTVKLTGTSLTGLQDVKTLDVSIALGFIASIAEAGFEDNSLPDGSGDGRDSWRNDLGGVIQITSSPTNSGSQAAKLPSAGDRAGYQRVEVEENTDYVVSFFYTMKSDPGTLTVSILDDSVLADISEVPGATIASLELTDNSDPNTYVREEIAFNSGARTEIAIFFNNAGSECRVDDFSID